MRRAALIVVVACRAPSPPPAVVEDAAPPVPSVVAPPAPARPRVTTDWCIEGLEALDEETCYVTPPLAEGKPRRLLVYVHGIIPPVARSTQKDAVMVAVKNAATRAGAVVIVPRGLRGIGPDQAKDWYAWPTSPDTHAAHAKAIVARWAGEKKKMEELLGRPFEKTYLAGSSNGAYFLTSLALSGDLERYGLRVDGYGAMSGGARTTIAAAEPRRFYVGFGAFDPDTKRNAIALVAALAAAKWPVKSAEHPVGHGAKEIYLDEAFAFWDE